MPVPARKRPLLAATKIAPPAKKASTVALERILDGDDAKKRHKKKLLQMKRKIQGTISFQNNKPVTTTTNTNRNRFTNPQSRGNSGTSPFAKSTSHTPNNRWSRVVKTTAGGGGASSSQSDIKDVFTIRKHGNGTSGLGGLANVPGYRKAKTAAESSSSGTKKHAKPKKLTSLLTKVIAKKDNEDIASNSITSTSKFSDRNANIHKRPRLEMGNSPYFASKPTSRSSSLPGVPTGPGIGTIRAKSLKRLPRGEPSLTASKPLTGLRLSKQNNYRSNTDHRRRLLPFQDEEIGIEGILPPPEQEVDHPDSSIEDTTEKNNQKKRNYDTTNSDDDHNDDVETIMVVDPPEDLSLVQRITSGNQGSEGSPSRNAEAKSIVQPLQQPSTNHAKSKPTRTNPPKMKKPVLSTASLLKSTEATARLLAGDDEKGKQPKRSIKPPAPKEAPPAPPAYRRRSAVVMSHKEETKNKANEKHRGKTNPKSHGASKKQEQGDGNHDIQAKGSRPVQQRAGDSTKSSQSRKQNKVNDNFVRLNMRNSAGSCRGARNKKRRSRYQERYQERRGNDEKKNASKDSSDGDRSRSSGHFYTSKRTGLDPLDDYVDGVFHQKARPSSKPHKDQSKSPATSTIPKCARHQRPCKLAVVKKTSTGNKGRKFYCCSMPRGEQCNHFEWADDTIEAARAALADNDSSSSGFITRQVAAYVERFRTLTVPELREEAVKRRLRKTGKKKELLFRLALWARDEIATSVHEDNVDNIKVSVDEGADSDTSSTSDDDSDCADDELELFHAHEETKCPDDGSDGEEEGEIVGTGSQKSKKLSMHEVLSKLFGHADFREGQEWAIQRCLDKKKSLLVAPTGFGKSLCYALPASMLDGISVVISPLVSLIQDQLRALPPRLPAATLSGSLSVAKTAAIIDDIIHKRIKILYVSPERLASPSFQRLFRTKWNPNTNKYERKFPEISLLCVDEAHCVSQWAHNFRPCFLRFQNILATMAPKSILAITATAGPRVTNDICETIGIPEPANRDDSVKVLESGRDNIDVSCHFVTSQEERLIMLSKILSPPLKEKRQTSASNHFGSLAQGSVIVYVWRQKDTEVVAEHLNSAGVDGGVVVYHGGMDAGARSRSQSMFMRGKARICVATVAFGMGIDKADVVGVVHMYLSSSPEHYLQEIGRAGRDGRKAKAIALPMMDEVPRRHSLEHSSIISKSQIRSLLFAIREVVQRSKRSVKEAGNLPLHVALPVRNSVLGCDCKSETLETLLSLIEQSGGSDPLIEVVGFNYDRAIIALKKRPLEKLAEREAVASSIRKVCQCFNAPIGEEIKETEGTNQNDYHVPESFQRQFLAYSLGAYSFSVVDCATVLGPSAEPRHVFAALRRMQSSNELEMSLDTSDGGRVFHLRASPRGHAFFVSDEFDDLATDLTDTIYERFSASTFSGSGKVLDMAYIMNEVAEASKKSEVLDTGKSTNLVRFQELSRQYLDGDLDKSSQDVKEILPSSFSEVSKRDLTADIMTIVQELPHLAKQVTNASFATTFGASDSADYSALSVTKFLHGMDTPRVPFISFRSHALFARWEGTEFSLVLQAVTEYLMASKKAA